MCTVALNVRSSSESGDRESGKKGDGGLHSKQPEQWIAGNNDPRDSIGLQDLSLRLNIDRD